MDRGTPESLHGYLTDDVVHEKNRLNLSIFLFLLYKKKILKNPFHLNDHIFIIIFRRSKSLNMQVQYNLLKNK